MHVCMYVCREIVEAVPASAPAATTTTFCSANISRLLIHSYWDKSISIALGSAAFLSGGVQNRLKKKSAQLGIKPKPYDFMFWTNLYMAITAAVLSVALGEGRPSLHIHTYIYAYYEVNNNLPYIQCRLLRPAVLPE